MKRDLPLGRVAAMLEQEDALPGAERQAAVAHRDGKLDLRQSGPQVRGHVVGSLVVMLVRSSLGRDASKIGLQVALDRGRSIFLDQQGRGCVAAEKREEAVANASAFHPFANGGRDFMESGSGRSNRE